MDFAGHSVAPWCEVINPESGFDQQSEFEIFGPDRRPVPTKDTRPLHLFFNRQIDKKYLDEIEHHWPTLEHRIEYCPTWDDFTQLLKLRPATICFHCAEIGSCSAVEIFNMVDTLSRLINLIHPDYQLNITVAVGKQFSYQAVRELRRCGFNGIIPAHEDFGWEETLTGLRAQWTGVAYWPKHILEQLPGYPKKKKPKVRTHVLTDRQHQIFDIITQQGLTNKQIARLLKISECTVKIHVSDLMRKYGCQNRTQLSVYRKKLGH